MLAVASLPIAASDLGPEVTANRFPQAYYSVTPAATVITRQDIELRQARSIEDLLQGVEGAHSDNLLVLIDGARMGSVATGMTALQNLPVDAIDRIEFVRGPRSSLYGSDAIDGVVQVFTRRGGKGLRSEFSVSGGSRDTRQAMAALQGGNEDRWFSVEGSAQSTEDYRDRSVSARAGAKLKSGTTIEATLLRAPAKLEFDDLFTSRREVLQQAAVLAMAQQISTTTQVSLRAGRTRDRTDFFFADNFQGSLDTHRDTVSAQWNLTLAARTLAFGVDYQNERPGTTAYTATSRADMGVFGQYVGEQGPWRTEFSLRGDDNEQFGRIATGTAAVAYTYTEFLQLLAQAGTGFKAPGFDALYHPVTGNPQLDPERSRSLELAATGHIVDVHWRASLFDTRLHDLIGYAGAAAANIDAAHIRGIETLFVVPWYDWKLDTGFTFQDAKDRADAHRGKRLELRPRLAGHVDVVRHFGNLVLGTRLVAESARYEDAANTQRLGGYATLDLRAEYTVLRDWRLQARVSNVFDHYHEAEALHARSGRALFLTVRYAGLID